MFGEEKSAKPPSLADFRFFIVGELPPAFALTIWTIRVIVITWDGLSTLTTILGVAIIRAIGLYHPAAPATNTTFVLFGLRRLCIS